nr:hypothetical protein [Tychonema sp. LEGE 07203]
MSRVNQQADNHPTTLRLSLDAKATVKIGFFSSGGKNRVPTFACDRDFTPKAKLTPYGIYLLLLDELFLLQCQLLSLGEGSYLSSSCL